MSESSKKFRPGGGCLALLFICGFFGFCCWLVYVASQPQDLSDIAAYAELKGGTEDATEGGASQIAPRNLLQVLTDADFNGDSVEITESELNRYLHMTLSPKQRGIFNLVTGINGVWIRLHDGFAEVIIERKIQGYETSFDHQFSYFIQVEPQEDGSIALDYNGGELFGGLAKMGSQAGQLSLPQSANALFGTAAESIAAVYEKELEFLTEKSARLEISQDRILYVGRGTGKPR